MMIFRKIYFEAHVADDDVEALVEQLREIVPEARFHEACASHGRLVELPTDIEDHVLTAVKLLDLKGQTPTAFRRPRHFRH